MIADAAPLPRPLRVRLGASAGPARRAARGRDRGGRACSPRPALAARRALRRRAADAAGGRLRPRRLAARRPERRRGLRLGAGRGVQPGDDRLGGARPGGGGRQPAGLRRRWRRTPIAYLREHRPRDHARPATSSARSWSSAAPGSTRATSRVATWSAACWHGAGGTAPGAARSTRPPSAILALRAAGHAAGNARSAAWLRGARNEDGGWGFVAGTAQRRRQHRRRPAGAGRRGRQRQGDRATASPTCARRRRRAAASRCQGGPVNAQSTAWAVQGLVAAGVSPRSVRRGGRSPLDYLASVQAGDGHYRYSRSSDQTPVWVTGQALHGR